VDSTTQFLKWVRGWSGRLEFAGATLTRSLAEQMPQASEGADGYGLGRGTDLDGFI
jgi:hypothetical protein